MQSELQFDYLDEFEFIFETNSGYESMAQVGAFMEKTGYEKYPACITI
jgi:hypothetical protein